ncbi:cyclophilin-like domain-containing protein, partial [Chytriomyces sp. MP71]
RLSFVLFGDAAPRAVENFLRLCDGTKGIAKASKKPLHYLGNRVHRIVEGYCVQWGDIVRNDGSGGESIYGGKFNDEPAALKLPISRGSLVMANSGKNSNTSQVFVVLTDDVERIKKNMQGKHVVIGRI